MPSVVSAPIIVADNTGASISSGSGISKSTDAPYLSSPAASRTVGSGSNQCDKCFPYTGTVVAGTPFQINLNTGLDQFGNALNMVHVTRVHVVHQGTTGKLTVGGGTHPVLGSDQKVAQPGGVAVFDDAISGYPVTSGVVAGVSPVEALPIVDSSGNGTFTLTYMGLTTGPITYSSTIATLISNINTALNTTFGTGNLVASGASLAALVITGSAGNYQYQPFGGHFTTSITGTGFTIGGASSTSTTSVAGIAPVSGQQDTLTISADAGSIPFSLIVLGRSA